jgi:hypothetical protein
MEEIENLYFKEVYRPRHIGSSMGRGESITGSSFHLPKRMFYAV